MKVYKWVLKALKLISNFPNIHFWFSLRITHLFFSFLRDNSVEENRKFFTDCYPLDSTLFDESNPPGGIGAQPVIFQALSTSIALKYPFCINDEERKTEGEGEIGVEWRRERRHSNSGHNF
jgi:hypothetical protein